jgi:hypothetical protein
MKAVINIRKGEFLKSEKKLFEEKLEKLNDTTEEKEQND